jgi:hypothetical protein
MMQRQRPYTYVELLSERGIIHNTAKVVEGCVGNTGWSASLHLARSLGNGAILHMVELDRLQLRMHEGFFKSSLRNGERLPALKWVAGAIEQQTKLISKCDALLFHNYVPQDPMVLAGKKVGTFSGQKELLRKIIDAGPRALAFYIPKLKEPDKLAELIESIGVKCEVIDGIDYAGELDSGQRDKWLGKAIISMLRA